MAVIKPSSAITTLPHKNKDIFRRFLEKPMAHYIHHVPGRLRVQTPLLKRDESRAQAAGQCLQTIDGVTAVRVSALTGSITVNYKKEVVNSDTILRTLEQRGYYRPDSVRSADGQLHDLATRAGSVAGKALFGFVVEKAVETSAMVLIGALL
jgi:copper chaperone CopZ